tara:strand:- start:13 stop:1689 length:1677 start_codon:yes stop_codon:yes gene_type:complete
MGWFTDTLNVIDKPSNALQGYVSGMFNEDEGRFEAMKRGWNQEKNYDFEQAWSPEMQKKGWSERKGPKETLSYIGSTALNVVFDPLNAIGGGMFKAGAKGADKAVRAGANVEKGAMKGSFISSVPNYIQGYYGPTKRTKEIVASMENGLLSDTLKFTTPYQDNVLGQSIIMADKAAKSPLSIKAYAGSKAVGGMIKTGAVGAKNIVKNSLDPNARALYRSEKINKGMLESGKISHKDDFRTELIHRAFYNMHIAEQSGAVGGKQLLTDFVKRLGYKGYEDFKPGSYNKASIGKHMGSSPASKAEANFIEEHVGKVWTDGKKVPLGEAKNTRMFLKRPAGSKSGDHAGDLQMRANEMATMAEVFKGKVPKDLNEFANLLANQKYTRKNKKGITESYNPQFKVDNKTGNVWVDFGMKGSSITEGGVNALVGIKPSGKFVAAISDEHNFLEKIPVLGRMVSGSLPNRLVAITPPIVGKIQKIKWKQVGKGSGPTKKETGYNLQKKANRKKQDNRSWDDSLSPIMNAKASPADLAYERARQLQGYGSVSMTGGLLTNDSSSR